MAVYTQSQIDALRRAYARGVTRVSYGDKSVEYRSLDEMKRVIAEMDGDVSGTPRSRRFYTTTQAHKGL
jgi:hypothetical protein